MKVGYIALVGRPNAGKSTLLNAIIGEMLAPITHVPQTTRQVLRGIYTDETVQAIFVDTPGIYEGKDDISKRLRAETIRALKGSDLVLHVIDSSRPHGQEDAALDSILELVHSPVIKIYTKGDLRRAQESGDHLLVTKETIEPQKIIEMIREFLPEGEMLYDPDYYTDTDPRVRIGEIIREEAFLRLEEEIPHALYVDVEDVENGEGTMKILAYIVVERSSQKGIVIGKGGSMIQSIGTSARKRLEGIYEKGVFLQLRVKVQENWRKNPRVLDKIFS